MNEPLIEARQILSRLAVALGSDVTTILNQQDCLRCEDECLCPPDDLEKIAEEELAHQEWLMGQRGGR